MIKLKTVLMEVDSYELEDLTGIDAILQYLSAHGKEGKVVELGTDKYIVWDDNILDPEYPTVRKKRDWIYGTDGSRLIRRLTDAVEEQFNARFWEHPETLFHATPTENVEAIKREGLKMAHKSRGMANKHIRAAVFTSTEPDWIANPYGPSVVTINTSLMKQDGFMPQVTKEPNHTESDVTNFIARKIEAWDDDRDLTNASSEGTTDDTVIVYSAIPPKYLSFELI